MDIHHTHAQLLHAALDRAGLRIEPSPLWSPSFMRTALHVGRAMMETLRDSPLALVFLEGFKRAFHPLPNRSRRVVMLRRAAGKSPAECARFLGVDPTALRDFERTGRGVRDIDIAALEAWLGRASRHLAPHVVADAIGVDPATYLQFETNRHPLAPSALTRLDQWLSEIVRRSMGKARYAVFPLRRLSERNQLAWDDVAAQLPDVFHRMLSPLIQAAMLDNVRFSLIGGHDHPWKESLPHDLWIPSHERIPSGAPTPDVLCHLWAPPDHPDIRQFFLGQWVVFAALSVAIETAQRMQGALAFEVSPLVVPSGGDDAIVMPVRCDSVLCINGTLFLLEGVTSRHRENQREAVRRMTTVLAPLIGSPPHVIGILVDPRVDPPMAIGADPVTVVSIRDVPALFESLFARHPS
ncbi:hypothetical protein [Roseiflexus castenholzii]|uniref:hypothetical protein n=1 Tax=Roseiflexus castenholzii TaxID=120962 RepID=UPI003C7DD5BB